MAPWLPYGSATLTQRGTRTGAEVNNRSKWRNAHHVLEGNRVRSFVVITGSAANAGVAIFGNPIRKAQPRSEVFRIVINGGGRASWIVILPPNSMPTGAFGKR